MVLAYGPDCAQTPCPTAADHTLYARWEKNIVVEARQDSVSCNGYTDGVITVKMTGGEGDYRVLLSKESVLVYDSTVTRSAVGDTTVAVFDGTQLSQGITAGNWTVKAYDTEHPQNTINVTGENQCQSVDCPQRVDEPKLLAFDSTRADSMTCYLNGKLYVHITGGTQPYTS